MEHASCYMNPHFSVIFFSSHTVMEVTMNTTKKLVTMWVLQYSREQTHLHKVCHEWLVVLVCISYYEEASTCVAFMFLLSRLYIKIINVARDAVKACIFLSYCFRVYCECIILQYVKQLWDKWLFVSVNITDFQGTLRCAIF